MPSVMVWIPNEIYKKLVYEAEKLGVTPTKLINMIVRVYYESKEAKEVSDSTRRILSRVSRD